jgi:predicted ester cyclase
VQESFGADRDPEERRRMTEKRTCKGTHTGPLASPQGMVPPTGRTLALRFCEIFEVEAGRIATHRTYYDQMEFAQQLGLIPATA